MGLLTALALVGGAVTWMVVCPDGYVRHFPYSIRENADADARVFDRRCRRFAQPNELEARLPPCERAPHAVKPLDGPVPRSLHPGPTDLGK